MIDYLGRLLEKHPELKPQTENIHKAYEIMESAFAKGGTLLVCGNGGSASDAEHIVGELMKGFKRPRPLEAAVCGRFAARYPLEGEYLARHLQGALPAVALSAHSALFTAFCNDVAADMAFAQQVHGYGRQGDVLLALSTSGNSGNILNAVRVANVKGVASVGITGAGGGQLAAECACCVRLPSGDTAEIQELTLPLYHALCAALEEYFF
ncbi:MAG: SIS domain-containing protein [Clostridiales bacterium]|jgi:D-sedoheptulose 7-phosphate isomerase|nr:SIS domain-containing protein [Clostridiales bacterium]